MIPQPKVKKTKAQPALKPPRRQRIVPSVEEIRFGVGQSSLGPVLIAFSEKGVVAILTGQHRDQLLPDLEQQFPHAHLVPALRDDLKLLGRVIAYVDQPAGGLDLPLDLRGTAFQKKVWKAVREIPIGQTSTYTEVARRIGSPKAMRAVGNACSMNGLAWAIPCHRVLRQDGLCYGKGASDTTRMRALLERERAVTAPATVAAPQKKMK